MAPSSSANLRLGSFYALVTSALLATQEPFSALGAKHLNPLYFVCITQAGLLLAVPLLTARRVSRHDFAILLSAPRNWSKLSKRVAALEASLPPPPSQYFIKDYCRGDDGFDAALAEIVEKDRGKPGGITDQHEVFSISVIKGLKGLNGQGEDLTIIRTVVYP